MPTTYSPRGAKELVEGQAIPEVDVNEIIRHTEAGACHFPVAARTTAAPGSCADGDSFIIIATASGAWTGKENQIATALGANAANGWRYHVPIEGFTAYVQDENARYLFGGASWAIDTTGGSYTDEQAQDAVGAMVDGTLIYTDATPLLTVTQEKKASDIASASTTNIGAMTGGFAHVTGTTTITAFDSATAGLERTLKFDGVLTLTHNATSLILPTAANITTAAGDTAIFRSEGSGNWRCISYTRASGAALVSSAYSGGKQSIPIMAAAMTARTTNGAAAGSTESATNKIMLASLDFDQSTAEYAQFMFPMPKSWNEGTITAQFIWKCGVTGNVIWGIQAVAISDDDVLDVAFGTAQTVTDGVTATTDVMMSAETSAVTIGGSPAEGDLVVFQVYRDASNGSDTAAGDALLIGIRLFITTNAADDS